VEFLRCIPDGTVTSDSVQRHGDDAYLHTGTYAFALGPAGDRRPAAARFSYMWRRLDGRWRITQHSSSALPSVPDPAHASPAEERAGGRGASDPRPTSPSINDPAFVASLARQCAAQGK
jgi:hypothetical protein